jgi:hypothetical protein
MAGSAQTTARKTSTAPALRALLPIDTSFAVGYRKPVKRTIRIFKSIRIVTPAGIRKKGHRRRNRDHIPWPLTQNIPMQKTSRRPYALPDPEKEKESTMTCSLDDFRGATHAVIAYVIRLAYYIIFS